MALKPRFEKLESRTCSTAFRSSEQELTALQVEVDLALSLKEGQSETMQPGRKAQAMWAWPSLPPGLIGFLLELCSFGFGCWRANWNWRCGLQNQRELLGEKCYWAALACIYLFFFKTPFRLIQQPIRAFHFMTWRAIVAFPSLTADALLFSANFSGASLKGGKCFFFGGLKRKESSFCSCKIVFFFVVLLC